MTTILTQQDIEHNTELLIQASQCGNLDEIMRLIPVSNPKAQGSSALRKAAKFGCIECVKLLLPVSDPKDCHSLALQTAVIFGHTKTVKLLIPFSDPKACNSEALLRAALFGYIEMVKLLIPVSDCKKVLERIQQDNLDTTLLEQYINEYNITQQILQQKERLINHLKNKAIEAPSSSKRKM